MSKTYKVTVNDEFEHQFSQDEINRLDAIEYEPGSFHILSNAHSFKGEITVNDFQNRNYEVRINSNTYRVDIANALDLLIEEMGLELSEGQKEDKLHAPMPGLILEIEVAEGDTVKEGDYVLVLEAMKMENALTAPKDGTIKSIKVNKGETVDKGQLLIEIE